MLAFVLSLIVPLTTSSCAPLAHYIADAQYGQVDAPYDREAAITASSVVPSPDIRAVIGGKGEGVDCSIPRWLEVLAFPAEYGRESSISLQFRQACVSHDYCYRHGYATYGFSQVDCDFLLLQQSFRTCIQIYEFGDIETSHTFAGKDTVDICRTRAREVLLGVRLGGVGSFKAHGESSYFEFDPMPALAQGYVISRLSNVGLDMRPIVIDGVPLLATPTTFQIERGRVYVRQLRWSADQSNAPSPLLGAGDITSTYLFPGDSVPTPPTVVRLDGKDRFVWLTRQAPHNTEFNLLLFADSLGGVAGTFRRLPCPRPSKTAAPKAERKCDFDASIIKVLPSTADEPSRMRVLAFSHRFYFRTPGPHPPAEGAAIGLHQWSFTANDLEGSSEKIPPVLSAARIDRASSHRNRYLQSELLVGEFRQAGCKDAVAFGRGVVPATRDEPETIVGKDYRTTTAVAFLPLDGSGCPSEAWQRITLPESTEPAMPVKDLTGVDRLLTFDALSDPKRVRVTEYGFAGHEAKRTETLGGEKHPLDASWVRSAVHVVQRPPGAPKDAHQGDRLFFSRVTVFDPSAKDDAPNIVELAFRYFRRDEAGWKETGSTLCRIDLDKQHQLEPAGSDLDLSRPVMHGKNGLIWRRARETWHPDKETQNAFWQKLYRDFDRREMARQWAQSQVIPGYIFDAETNVADRPIDAVVIFHGSADYSLLLQGVRGTDNRLDRLELRRPNRASQFVDCS